MSELIHMRQRMKATKTIQKITRAMCLVSMSTHTRLRVKRQNLDRYTTAISELLQLALAEAPDWDHPFLNARSNSHLIIIIGSEKGLCGNFNTNLAAFISTRLDSSKKYQGADIIHIGQKIGNFAKQTGGTNRETYERVSLHTIDTIAAACLKTIIAHGYSHVTIFSNHQKTFFTQKPSEFELIPLSLPSTQTTQIAENLIWEQSPTVILEALILKLVNSSLQNIIFESFLAEQAARFVAMDGATRNANTLLIEMRLNYNKIRQAKITRELTDLVGSFF